MSPAEAARHRRRNVILLALCQAAGMSSASLMISVTALVGADLAPDVRLATLPLALQWVAVMILAAPASFLMKHHGRRLGLSLGAVCGILAGLLGAWAISTGSFWLFCLTSLPFGAATVGVQFYRFAAADTADEAFKARAISLVLAGGVIAAVLGPELAKQSKDLLQATFAGGYLMITGLSFFSLLLLQFTTIPKPDAAERSASGRPILQLARQPVFIVAVLCALVGYGSMNLVMTVTPPAMLGRGHAFDSAALVIQWHVLGMYAPSFFTGHLIARFGIMRILTAGALLILGCAAVNLLGDGGVVTFAAALILLGLGWNFLFVGGTTLLTESYRPEEKAKVQALNEFLVWGTVACTALTAGALHNAAGWQAINFAVVPSLVLVLLALTVFARHRRRTAEATASAAE